MRFIKYCIVGATSTIIDTLVLALLVELVRMDPVVGKVFSQVVAITNGYWLNKLWTFNDRKETVRGQFIRFAVVSVAGLLIALIIFYVFTELLHIWYIAANILTALIVVVWNFNINRLFTFK